VALDTFYCQDFILDMKHLQDTIEKADEEIGIYPLWLCPAKHLSPHKGQEDMAIFDKDDLQVDIGVYGFSSKANFDGQKVQRTMEEFITHRKG